MLLHVLLSAQLIFHTRQPEDAAVGFAQLLTVCYTSMSQEAVAPRVRLNVDVWRHTAAMLGDPKSLSALEAVSRELMTLV